MLNSRKVFNCTSISLKKILLLFPFRAEAAGITIFQEIGLDPGIDHLLAMNCFDSVKESGGKVCTYYNPCERIVQLLGIKRENF